jgi:hypothetical protein
MGIRMDVSLSQINLSTLADRCTDEMKRRRRKQDFDDRYCLEIFRRAILQHIDQAWSVLQQRFSETVRIWLHSHPSHDVALLRDSEENYVAQTFSRFWLAVHDQHLEFATLNSALSYLHATLSGILTDALRAHLRSKEVPFPEPGLAKEPIAVEPVDGLEIWQSIQGLIPDERERRLMYLLYFCGLKPREIVIRCPQEFDDVKEIYRLNHNIIERLRRNQHRLRQLLGDEEVGGLSLL